MTKYGARKAVVDGYKFDSKMEADYYIELKKMKEDGEVLDFTLQPKFLLQDSFRKRDVLFRKIEYFADFQVETPDGKTVIVDVKGMETPVFKIKQKLFEKKYPSLELRVITKNPKKFGGGWIEVDELKKLRREEKKRLKNK